jgi:signal transduction histidine kinase
MIPAAQAKGVRLDWASPSGLTVTTDRERLRRILTNLVSNGVKFTDQGSVRIDAAAEVGDVVFRVRDTGIGIRPEDQEQVFEPFWQVDQSNTRVAGGTGLGLSIVKRLVEQLGGTLVLDSQPGEGSTLTFRLSRYSRAAPGSSVGRKTAMSRATTTSTSARSWCRSSTCGPVTRSPVRWASPPAVGRVRR